MQKSLREALARLWRSWWRRAPAGGEQAGSGRLEARARFWAEFRAGQREADAHAAKLRP